MGSERGRVSGSFLLAVVTVVAAIGGYTVYSLLRPDPYELSERIVRDSRRLLSSEVREFQREVDTTVRETKRKGKDAADQVDRLVGDAMRGIDRVVDDARSQLADLDVELRTQRNRMGRITGRAQEAREMIEEYAEEAKAKAGEGK
jgi:hypothetical protein